jgi:ATP dependent DNA ligase domain
VSIFAVSFDIFFCVTAKGGRADCLNDRALITRFPRSRVAACDDRFKLEGLLVVSPPWKNFLVRFNVRGMLWGSSRGRPLNAPAAFVHPCQPTVAKQPPTGPGWVHELKHDGYRLQIHVRDSRVRLFTMNGADWSKRYPRIVEEAARIKGSAVMDAEVVCLVKKGVPDFDMLHSRNADHLAVACAFDAA